MKKGIKITCPKCGWKWVYKGSRNIYACCSNCMSQVKIKGEVVQVKHPVSHPLDSSEEENK